MSLYCNGTLDTLIKRILCVNFDDLYIAAKHDKYECSSTVVYLHAEMWIGRCRNKTLGGIIFVCVHL